MLITLEFFILSMTIIITIAIVIFQFVYTKAFSGGGWKPLKEFIVKIIVPLGISLFWISFTFFNLFSLIILISLLISFFMFLILYQTEYFFGVVAELDCLGRYTLYFHRFLERPDVITFVKLYHASEFNTELIEIFNMIEMQIEQQYKKNSDEIKKLKNMLKLLKNRFTNTNVKYYFYLDTRQYFVGCKCLVILTNNENAQTHKIEGAIFPAGTGEFFGRKMEINVLFDGNPTSSFLQKLETFSDVFANVFNSASDIKLIPILKEQLKRETERSEEMRKIFYDEVAREAIIWKTMGLDIEKQTNRTISKFINSVIVMALIIAIPMILFIILSVIGVI